MTGFPLLAVDPEGIELELTRERWSHIVSRHGELSNCVEEVLETVRSPEEVVAQSGRNDTFHYFREVSELEYNDYICVVVNVEKEFLVTAYPTSRKKV
ncbi:MAG: hypothetical protein ABEJ83_02030 [Candidatus Nanohaloarchaea archaeon]